MSLGRSAGPIVRARDLQRPAANPRPNDPTLNVDLNTVRGAYVFDGDAVKIELQMKVLSSETVPISAAISLYNCRRKCFANAGAGQSTAGVSTSSFYNRGTTNTEISVVIDFRQIPSHVLYIPVGAATTSNFERATGLEFKCRQLEGGRGECDRLLGNRLCLNLHGQAVTLFVFVRCGAWWHLHCMQEEVPGCQSPSDVWSMWGRGYMSELLKRSGCAAQAQPPLGKRIVFRVCEGHDLAVKDKSFFRRGSSDPFLVVTCGDLPPEEYATQSKTLEPRWTSNDGVSTTCSRVVASDPREIVVMMYDRDRFTANDFMGRCCIPLSALWNLDTGTTYLNLMLAPLDSSALSTLKGAEYKIHNTRNVHGHITVEVRVEDEALSSELQQLLSERS